MLLQELMEEKDDDVSDRKVADIPTEDELDHNPSRPRRKITRSKPDKFKKESK